MATIDISGLDKVELLFNLWNNQPFIAPAYIGNPLMFDDVNARKAVTRYIDYFNGRPIKTDLSKDTVDTWLYNRDAGKGKFEAIVEMLRKRNKD
jgi:hypothetical protein